MLPVYQEESYGNNMSDLFQTWRCVTPPPPTYTHRVTLLVNVLLTFIELDLSCVCIKENTSLLLVAQLAQLKYLNLYSTTLSPPILQAIRWWHNYNNIYSSLVPKSSPSFWEVGNRPGIKCIVLHSRLPHYCSFDHCMCRSLSLYRKLRCLEHLNLGACATTTSGNQDTIQLEAALNDCLKGLP